MFWCINEPSSEVWSEVKKNDKNDPDHYRPEQNDTLVLHYEQLRGDALSHTLAHQSAKGLALFHRQGMVAWMRAWSQCIQKADGPAALEPFVREPLPLDLRTQIAMVLAGIILAVH